MLLLLLAAGYAALYWGSLSRGFVPRPMSLLYGYEPWNRQRPPPGLLPAAPVLFDEVVQFVPWLELTRRELLAGRVPLWNPYQFCGAPHLGASQPAVLSPLTWLALPRAALAQHLARFCGFLVAGLGMYLWLGTLGLGAAAGGLGAVAFAFCGFLTLWAGHPHFLSAVWLPLLLCGVERLVGRPLRLPAGLLGQAASAPAGQAAAGARAAARAPRLLPAGAGLVAGALALSLLGGHVETSFHLGLVGGLYALGCTLAAGVGRARLLLRVVAAQGLGLLLAAAAVLPFLDYLLQSAALASRQGGFELERGLPWQALLCLLNSEWLGGEPFGPFRLERLNLNEVAGGFVGPVVLGLALACRRRDLLRSALLVAGASVLLAFEPWPVGALAARLPLLGLAYNGRLLLALALVLSVLGAAGLEAALAGRSRAGQGLAAVAGACLLAGVAGREHLSWTGVALPLGALLAAGGLLAGLRRRPGRGIAAALVAIAALPALRLGAGYHGGAAPEAVWPALGVQPASVRALGIGAADRFAGFGRLALPPELATAYGLRDVRGYDAMTPRAYEELLSRVEPLARVGGRLAIFRLRTLSRWASPLYEFLGVRLVLLGRGAEAQSLLGLPHLQPLGAGFAALREGRGRAGFARRALYWPDESALLAHLASAAFDPDVPSFLGPAPADGLPLEAADETRVPVRFVLDEPGEVLLELDAPGRGHVVLADTALRGWHVFVDGRPAEPLRANHAFRAVVVPAGRHRVRWIYRPDSFVLGAFLSSLCLCFMLASWTLRWGFDRVRKPSREEPDAEQGHAHRQPRQGS